MQIVKAAMLTALSLLLTTPARAQSAVGDDADHAARRELTQLANDTVLLRARLAKAQAAAELHKATLAANDDAPGAIDAPVVTGVFGRDGRNYADFLYATGGVVPGAVGDTIPGGYRVTTVTADHVELLHGSVRVRVALSGLPPKLPVPPPSSAAAEPMHPQSTGPESPNGGHAPEGE